MTRLTIDEARELLPAYALGALEQNENVLVERALEMHPVLRAELDEFRAVTDAIATGAEVTPPPQLRERFLTQISASDNRAAEAPARAEERIVSIESRKRTSYVVPTVLTLALAASLVFLVQSRNEIARLQQQAGATATIIASRDSVLKLREETLNTLLGSADALVVVNMEAPQQTGPAIQFFWNVSTGKAVLNAYRLPQAPAGRAYQLWFIKDGKPMPSRVFNSDNSGRQVVASIDMPATMNGMTAVAITEEPEGGSAQPTTTPFLVGSIKTQ
jgi:anti-sigma-K factor RskA